MSGNAYIRVCYWYRMGKKLEAKYESGCKICGEQWHKGDEICWDKINGKTVTCTDIDCFSHQGGSLSYAKKAFGDPAHIIITNVPAVRVSEDTNVIGGLWKQYFVKAHELTKEVYPQEDVSSDRFGMIRQTVLNQLVAMAGVVVSKRGNND